MDATAFKQRLLPLSRQLYWAAYRLAGNCQDAEDLVQDVYAKLWAFRDRLPPDMNDLPYCLRTLRNVYHNRLRANRLETCALDGESLEDVAADDAPDAQAERRELSQAALKIMETLPEQQRRVMAMKDIDGLSVEDIAARTGLTPGNLRVVLSRARKTVRQRLETLLAARHGGEE